MSLTLEAGRFVTGTSVEDLPDSVIALGKSSILDALGLALAGSVAESGKLLRRHLSDVSSEGACTVIGADRKVPSRFAALANATAIHADDYDDTQLAVGADRVYGLLTHPTAPALPAALAVAEERSQSGMEFMLAYHLGVELECKIAEAIEPRHYNDGFHSTGTCGTFAAAGAAAKLRGLTLEATLRALAIAASQSAGLRENFGSMTKPLHAGRASESGVVAADLAGLGWTAAPNILEAERGFFNAHGGGYDADSISGRLGAPWTFDNPGVSIKPHPSGSLTHPAMTEMRELIRAHDISPGRVKEVSIGTNRHMPNALIHHDPTNALQGKFSMEFCIAILLLERHAGLEQFTDAVVKREDVQAMMKRIRFEVDVEAEEAGYNKMTSIVEITLDDGQRIRGRADYGKGSPANPMLYDEVAGKFRECADFAGWDSKRTEAVISTVHNLESLRNIKEITTLLSK